MRVVKLSGHELSTGGSLRSAAQLLAGMEARLVVVHGGGPLIDDLQARLGHTVHKVQGLRVTDQEALLAALMVLCGRVNKQLVAALLGAGMDAVGLSGVDAGLIKVRKLRHAEADLGFVGEVQAVRTELLHALLGRGLTPVIAPLSLGEDGRIYNVNADQIAGAIAAALPAEELLLLSNVPGVVAGGRILPRLDREAAEALIGRREIAGGMVPKVQAGLRVLRAGVARVRIADFEGLQAGGGTLLVAGGQAAGPED